MISGGQSFVSSPPVFSHDGKNLLVCTGRTVSVFSTTTGMLVTELDGHSDSVTSIVVVPVVGTPASKFLNYCWTSSLDGMIFYWDFSSPELIKKIKVDLPIHSMIIPNFSNALLGSTNKSSQNTYAVVSVEDSSRKTGDSKHLHGQIQVYDLTKSHRVGALLAETRTPKTLTLSKSGEYLGITNKRMLQIWKTPSKNSSKFGPDYFSKVKLHHTKTLTCLAIHPTERMIAGGDETGRVLIWRGVGKNKFDQNSRGKVKNFEDDRAGVRGNDDAEACSTWHWHSSAIQFLSFSEDGAYLFSGGKEGVIVLWQLETGNKKFKPHLGSPLLHFTLSPDPSLSCVSCADNSIHILQMPGMEIIKSICGIKCPYGLLNRNEGEFNNNNNNNIGFDRSNGLIALPTEDYCVQFYNLFDNTEVSNVQVIERNYQPVDETTVFVLMVEVSEDGTMMCTVEEKLPEDCLGGLVTLKFWSRGPRNSDRSSYSLSTVIYEPHSDERISDVAFRPGRSMAVTTSFGGNFKVWANISSNVNKDEKKERRGGWRCQSVGSYKGKAMCGAAFSGDGSVLAVSADTTITLWDPDSNVLLAVLGDSLSPIRRLAFVGCSDYIISVSFGPKPQLAVWNLSNLSLQWSYKLFIEDVCCMKNESYFAVLANYSSEDSQLEEKDGLILFFNVENHIPISSWFVKKVKGGRISFVVENQEGEGEDKQLLAYINGGHEYIVFDPNNKENEGLICKSARKRPQIHSEESVAIGYASIYGELSGLNNKRNEMDIDLPFVPKERPWENIFNGSSHVLPPLSKLCSSFLESLLEKKSVLNV